MSLYHPMDCTYTQNNRTRYALVRSLILLVETRRVCTRYIIGAYDRRIWWKVQISEPTVLEFVTLGSEKDVIGEGQGFDFFCI